MPVEIFEVPTITGRSINQSDFSRKCEIRDFSCKEAHLVVVSKDNWLLEVESFHDT